VNAAAKGQRSTLKGDIEGAPGDRDRPAGSEFGRAQEAQKHGFDHFAGNSHAGGLEVFQRHPARCLHEEIVAQELFRVRWDELGGLA